MPIILNKRKDFKKEEEVASTPLKAQDETIQITRKEWDAMQESLTQLQTFMNDLVEGNLEIEIVDEGAKEEKPEEKEENEIELEEVKEDPKPDPKPDSKDVEPEIVVEEDKGEDDELEETLKDPAKRKAVLEYLKATDAIHPVKDMNLSQIRKRVSTIVSREHFDVARKGSVKMTPSEVINEIMSRIKKEKSSGKPLSVEALGKIANRFLNSFDLQEKEKAEDTKTLKRKTIKKSIDSAIPDFTSRFEDKTRVKKAVDNNRKDLSKDFSDRFK